MKKIIFILLTFISLSANSENLLQNVTKTASNIVDSAKIATITAINTTDTSSNFKMIYQDVKEGLTGLAQGLKVGVEHVYKVLVKQQVVTGITNLIDEIKTKEQVTWLTCKPEKYGF